MTSTFTIFFDDRWITVGCLNNPTINRWYETAKLEYNNPGRLKSVANPVTLQQDNEIVKTNYNEILSAIDELRAMGVEWLDNEPSEFNFDQQWCNRVHRYFTTLRFADGKVNLNQNSLTVKDEDKEKFISLLYLINDNVHIIENFCQTEQKKIFQRKLRALKITPNIIENDYKFNDEDYQNHTWEHHNVVFDNEILGKHILNSFFDDDDPQNFDTTGHYSWRGSFRILIDSRTPIYESMEFNDWMKKYNVSRSSLRADFPIGNVIDSSHKLNSIWIDNLQFDRACTIEFHN
jgi:hypothetical protein